MITGWEILGSDDASLIICTPVPGMLNAIRFALPIGGGLAFDALMACRNVQPVPHVDPSVSAVEVMVKVILAAGVSAARDCGVRAEASRTGDIDSRATSTVIWSAAARMELSNNLPSEVCFIAVFPFTVLVPEIRGEVPENFEPIEFSTRLRQGCGEAVRRLRGLNGFGTGMPIAAAPRPKI